MPLKRISRIVATAAAILVATASAATAKVYNFRGTLTSGVDGAGLFGNAGESLAGKTFTARIVFHSDGLYGFDDYPMFTFLAVERASVHYAINGVGVGLTGRRWSSEGQARGGDLIRAEVFGHALTDDLYATLNSYLTDDEPFFGDIWGGFYRSPERGSFSARLSPTGAAEADWTTFASGGPLEVWTGGPSAVPEPATWAMMIAGFGLAGAGLRRSKRQLLGAA